MPQGREGFDSGVAAGMVVSGMSELKCSFYRCDLTHAMRLHGGAFGCEVV